jgi:hypothetical protein
MRMVLFTSVSLWFPAKKDLFMPVLLFLLAFFLLPNTLPNTPAPPVPNFSTRALVGKIGEHPVHMVLDYYQGSISGSYYYQGSLPSVRSWLSDLQLQGNVNAQNGFEMTESSPVIESTSRQSGKFSGILKFDETTSRPQISIEGTWSSADGKKTLPFKLTERGLQPGSKFRLETGKIKEKKEKIYRIEVNYPQLVPASDPTAVSFNKEMTALVNKFVKNFKDDILEYIKDLSSEEKDEALESSLEIEYEVVFASENIISIIFRERFFHGYQLPKARYSQYNFNFDLRKGLPISFATIFKQRSSYGRSMMELWNRLIAKSFWKGETIDEALTKDFPNWSISEKGLIFNFPVAQNGGGGNVEMFVPYSQLEQILASDGPLSNFAKTYTILDYYKLLPIKYFLDEEETRKNMIERGNSIIDIKNGYLFAQCDGGMACITMALFKMPDGRDLIGVYADGTDIYRGFLDFFFYENRQWNRVTKLVLPVRFNEEYYYELPRQGTTIKVSKSEKRLYDLIWQDGRFKVKR